MPIKITTAAERMAQRSAIKGVIFGASKIGKTTLIKTLDPDTTLVLDLEAGMVAVEDHPVDSINIREMAATMGIPTWGVCRGLAVLLSGPDPMRAPGAAYSQSHFEQAEAALGPASQFDKYATVFVDSITVAGRACFAWSLQQPGAFNKDGVPDKRGAYGEHGQEMVTWLTQLQHVKKNVWLAGILDAKKDDYGRMVFEPQIEGSKTGLELPGIVDEVLTLAALEAPDGSKYRGLVCHRINQWGFPAGDRSGRLELVEEPHLGRLMEKIAKGPRVDKHVSELPAPKQIADDDVPF